MINLADRQIINILAQDIKADLRLSDAQLGLLTGLAFGVVYSLVGLPLAWLADRMNRVRIVALMLAFWSLCTIACGAAAGFASLFLARMGVGAGEGGAQPACTSLARDLFPSRGTTALAVVMAGTPVGGFVGFLAGGALAGEWGWRVAFVLAGLPGLVLAAGLSLVVREVRVPSRNPTRQSLFQDLQAILRRPRVPMLILAVCSSMLILYGIAAWLPAFFIRTQGFSTAEMGLYGALATGIGGGFGTGAGLFCDRLGVRFSQVESKFVILAMLASVPLLFISVAAHDAAIALGGYFLLNFATYAWLAPATRLIQDAVDPQHRALAFAVCGGAGMLFGLGAGVPLIGWASDLLAPDFGARAVGIALAAVLPLAAASAIGAHLRLLRTAPEAPSTA